MSTSAHWRTMGMLIVLTLCCVCGIACAGVDKGVRAYQREDYATALREWLPLAEQGDAAAQYHLGMLYIQGKGVSQDYAEAVQWWRRAAEQSHVQAQAILG